MKKIFLSAALLVVLPAAFAQSSPSGEQKSPSPLGEKKSPPPLGEQKSPSPLGEGRGEGPATKALAKKSAPRKPAPKKPVPPKKPVAKAAPKPPAGPPNVTVYKSSQKMPPTLRDKEGNLIPTSPDAYDVSSAAGKKK